MTNPELRRALEERIETYISLLDRLDGDPDFEGDADSEPNGDDEPAGDEMEPWLGWAEIGGYVAVHGNLDDREGGEIR
ncbi:MAG: hypothetical protein H6873_05565 [Hyphomicrobiaceae bacterium]|nr:hypothetical protein [Hyphomicrobiaceae bacterium]